jgi:hypothetical protein
MAGIAGTGEFKVTTGRFELMLEEDAAKTKVGGGYNPYDTVPNAHHADSSKRHADLRQLSDWIRLKRQMAKPRTEED